MIEDLNKGVAPAPDPLRLRLQAAMIKKLAMMRLPREFQHNDNKINPNSAHMLWAAILVEDDEALETMGAILLTEAHDNYEAQRGAMAGRRPPPNLAEILRTSLHDLLAISTDRKLNLFLKHKIKKTSVIKELPMIKI